MANAIGIIEFKSIACGVETCDIMMKASKVELLRAATMCPGKYIIIIGGQTGEVSASMKAGLTHAGNHVADSLHIPHVHAQLMPAISGKNPVVLRGALGVLEFYTVADAIRAADATVKAANITLMQVRTGFAIAGKGMVTITGDVGAVRTAVDRAKAQSEHLLHAVVIPRPNQDVFDSLC